MKQIYTIFLTVVFIFITERMSAQCTCANGDPIDSLQQDRIMTGILPFTSTVSFNKLDPSIGTLACLSTRTTVFTKVNIEIANRDTTARVLYQYNYTRTTSLIGPGINVSASSPRVYGPFELGQAGVDPDTIAYFGPDTLFNNIVMTKNTSSSLGSYMGTGTVNFTYSNSAIAGFVIGNSNNQTTISDYSEVTIQMVYYFCPLIILGNHMKSLSLSRTNNGVALSWVTDNDEPGYTYEVESSDNGRNFKPIVKFKGKGKGNQQYNVDHQFNAPTQGKMYFRIKLTDLDGKSAYSTVKSISFGDNGDIQPSIYPNPVVNDVNLRFGAPQTGTLTAELISLNGQVLQSRQIKANRLTNIQFSLNRKYTSGAYFMRVRNGETGNQAVTRVFIQ